MKVTKTDHSHFEVHGAKVMSGGGGAGAADVGFWFFAIQPAQ